MMPGTETVWVAVATLAAVTSILLSYSVRVIRVGRLRTARLEGERGTALLGRYPIEAFHWALRAVGKVLVRSGLSPDTLTILSLVFTAATIPLAATGQFELSGLMLLFGSAFDAFDGIVARELGIASDGGEMLDAVIDRYADACCLLGLALFYRTHVVGLTIVLGAMIGSMMVSYVRAKAEALGVDVPAGLMRRPERIAYLAGALVFGRVLSSWLPAGSASAPATLAVVGMVAVISNLSAVQMLSHARSQLRARRRIESRAA